MNVNEPCSSSDGFVLVIIQTYFTSFFEIWRTHRPFVSNSHIINKFALVCYHKLDPRIKVTDEQRKNIFGCFKSFHFECPSFYGDCSLCTLCIVKSFEESVSYDHNRGSCIL